MASVVQASGGNYDMARGLSLYDPSGDLPERARELWTHIHADGIEMAREFWRRYARSPEVREHFDDSKIDQLAQRIVPYIASKFERLDSPQWTHQARDYVERSLGAGLTLSTLLSGGARRRRLRFRR